MRHILFVIVLAVGQLIQATPTPLLDFPTPNSIRVVDYSKLGMSDFDAIQAAVNALDSSTPTLIEFESRTYIIEPPNDFTDPLIWIDGRSNVIIDGKGADLVLKSEIPLFRANDCENIIFKNYTLDYDPLPFTQGTIQSFDMSTKKVTVKLDTGYRPINEDFSMESDGGIRTKQGFLIKNKDGSGAQKRDVNNTYNAYNWSYNEQTLVYTGYLANFIAGTNPVIEAGDKFVLLVIGILGNTHSLPTTKNVTIMNARIYSAYNAVFYVGDSENLGLINNKIYIKPNTNRLQSGVRDGIIGSNTYQGALVENCLIEANGDDGLNFSPRGAGILEPPTGNTLKIFQQTSTYSLSHTYHYRAGDTISIFSFDQKKEIYTGRITNNIDNAKVDVNPDPTIEDLRSNRTLTLVGTGAYLGQEIPSITDVPDGDLYGGNIKYLVFDRSKGANNFIIRNSIFRYNRRYGLLLGATSGTIENNLFEGTGANAISYRYEDITLISYHADKLVLQNNTFHDCFLQVMNPNLLKEGIVSIEGPVTDGEAIHDYINIRNNHFTKWEDHIPFNLNNIKTLDLYGNTFCDAEGALGATAFLLGDQITTLNQSGNDIGDFGCKNATPTFDVDGDGISDSVDNCVDIQNANQLDVNENGIGNLCDPLEEKVLSTATQSIYVDFGVDDGYNGNTTLYPYYWNNITDGYAINQTQNGLVNTRSESSGISVEVLSDFSANGIQNGALLFPEVDLLGSFAVPNATQDYFYVSGTSGVLKFSGLNPLFTYQFSVFGSRNSSSTRISNYEFVGENNTSGSLQTSGSGLGIGSSSENGNDSSVYVSDNITPNSLGETQVIVSVNTGGFAYVNAMRIEEFSGSLKVATNSNNLKYAFFPNPIKEYLYIEQKGIEPIVSIELISLTGKLMRTYVFREKIDMSTLNSGIYILNIHSKSSVSKHTIIKQ